ncbi:MAG: hypothetical protein ACYTGW_20875 [Planctomycetota bacterium]|jgi:DNA-binding NtrC family response regulator
MRGSVELLVIAREEQTVTTLCAALEQQGIAIDIAGSATQARTLFLDRGGHRLLVVGPDAGQGMAQQVVNMLRSVDPQLPVVAFGADSFRDTQPQGLMRIPDFHPSSRAGIGAVLKAIRSLA